MSKAILLITLCSVMLVGCGDAPEGLNVGNRAPDVTVKEVGTEKSVKLSDLKGKVVLMDFWATWCGPCRMIEPEIDELYSKYKDKGFEVLAISNEPIHEIEKFAKERKEKYPLHHDFAGLADGSYKIESIPRQFLVGRDGKIIWEQTGARRGDVTREVEKAMQ
jgi:cytochrome c biogenesis protein CcmG, thiol:disulfide interchange protein DsbE